MKHDSGCDVSKTVCDSIRKKREICIERISFSFSCVKCEKRKKDSHFLLLDFGNHTCDILLLVPKLEIASSTTMSQRPERTTQHLQKLGSSFVICLTSAYIRQMTDDEGWWLDGG